LITAFFCQFNSSFGQDFFPPITNYTTDDYGHQYAPDNHGITQDKSSVMYFGNTGNVLAFDGTRWEEISIVHQRVTRSLYTAKDGTIYVGVMGDFGYLSIDSIGSYKYKSLLDSSLRVSTSFQDIWTIIETSEGIFIQSEQQVFLYKNDKVTLLPMPSTVHTVFKVNDKLVARMRDFRLMQWNGDEWERIKGSEPFEIYAAFGIIPMNNKEHLIITQEIGLYKLTSHNTVEPVESQNNEFLNNQLIFGARKIGSDRIALKTFNKGADLIDFEGDEFGKINKRMGLRSNEIKSQFIDFDGNLWMGLGNGIALVNLDSRLSYFGENQGLIGDIKTVLQTKVNNNNDQLFVGTNEGLFRINQEDESLFKIYEKLESIKHSVWSLKQFNNLLFIGASEGLFTLDLTLPPVLNLNVSIVKM
jgi:AraC family chitin signaling transcriptional activator